MKKPLRPWAEKLKIAKQINDYRAANPELKLPEVWTKLELTEKGVTESNYWAWRKRLEVNEAVRKANSNGEETTEHFPLVAIPERPKAAKKAKAPPKDDDKQLARLLLEVAARLLRR